MILDLDALMKLVITGADRPYSRGWYDRTIGWVHEIVYLAENRIERWENGKKV